MNPNDDNSDPEASPKIPYRRDRTPSIVVQSLGLSFQKDSAITGSIELHDDDSSPNTSEESDPKSSTSGNYEAAQNVGPCDSSCGSAKGSLSSLQNSTSPGTISSPISSTKSSQPVQQPSFNPKSEVGSMSSNRRLSLNIGSTAPRRQSLTVDGLSSASFINPSGNATGSLRNKVALKPGHSLMGWIKLASTAKDLSGTGGKIMEVSQDELAKHNTEEDCWVALKGNVYNVTTYLHYHPGGVEELMRGAGRDATELFNEVHRWVNYESILAKCLIGPFKIDSPLTPKGRATFKTITEDSSQQQSDINERFRRTRDPTVAQKPNRRQSIALTVPSPNKYQSLLLNNNSNANSNQIQQPPTYVIMQDKSSIKVKIQDLTTLPLIRSRHLICDLNEQLELHISIILSPDWLYRIHLRLDQEVQKNNIVADLTNDDRTVIVQLNKKEQSIWNKIGTSLNLNDSLCEMTLADKFFRPSKLMSKKRLTHDTYLFEFKLSDTLMYVPIGWHVLIREHIPNLDLTKKNASTYDDARIYKNYTPVLPTLTTHNGLVDEAGFMSSLYFIIKIYHDGVVTRKLNQLKIGDSVDISDYQCVDFDIETAVGLPKRHWLLLAAGTGLTPFCRIIPYLLSQTEELVETITLVFFNKTQEDIIWKDLFEALAIRNDSRFKVVHVLSDEVERRSGGNYSSWLGRRGRINKGLFAEFVDTKSPDELKILSCGPRAFTQLTKSIASELNLLEKLYIFHG